jgi:hypothetical protein
VLFPRNVRTCGCPRTIWRTRPHGHHHHCYSSVTSTPSFFPTVGPKRTLCRLSHRSMLGLVVDSVPRTVSLSSSRMIPSPSQNVTDSLTIPLCGMRVLSPVLLLLSYPHNLGSPNRFSVNGSPSGTSNLCLRPRVALKNYVSITTVHSTYRAGLCTSDGDDYT